MRIGSHMSTAGGVDRAFARAEDLGLEAMQIFTRNQNQWASRPLDPEVINRFRSERDRTGIEAVCAHESYLINLCAVDPEILEKSKRALADELLRCEQLEIPYLVAHPGSHLGQGEEAGLAAIAANLNRVFAERPDCPTVLLLENTAGQGTNLGYRFEHLAAIRDQVDNRDRVGVCFDTCHATAAGYDLSTTSRCRKVMKAFDQQVGLDLLKVFHLNDSKKPLGSRVDRHEHVGEGHVGLEGFKFFMRSRIFRHHPLILETPKSPDYHEDLENIATLKGLL